MTMHSTNKIKVLTCMEWVSSCLTAHQHSHAWIRSLEITALTKWRKALKNCCDLYIF